MLDCTNVPFGNRSNACDGLVAYGSWDMRLVPILSISAVALCQDNCVCSVCPFSVA